MSALCARGIREIPAGRLASAVLVLVALSASAVPAEGSVEIEARVERRTLALGESTPLEVVVRGGQPSGEPVVDLPQGLEILGTSRAQNFSWVNGRMSSETVFRYEIAPSAAGHYEVGPIVVKVGSQSYRSGSVTLDVTAAPQRLGAAGEGPASLTVEVTPREPYVGQQVTMRVRLIQRVPFAEDPQYIPPTTTGFWTDKPSPPESYYADQRNQRVLVTETRTRLYPLAVGDATLGEAQANVVLGGGEQDPFAWLRGGGGRREMIVRSPPVAVRVRPLPEGAPVGFGGAVGRFQLEWTADRSRTPRDVPVTVRLDVRGAGNLPLIRPPALEHPDLEVFARTSEDSLAPAGGDGSGRKRFQWTVLPRRQGRLILRAPRFAWFDPESGTYRQADPSDLILEVGPPLSAGAGLAEGFPTVFAEHEVDPGARDPEPWAFAVAGLALGAAGALWRESLRKRADGPLRAQQLEWLRAVGTAVGPDFWQAADEASAWLEAHPGSAGVQSVRALRAQIAASLYGGVRGETEAVRRPLVERLSQTLPPPRSPVPLRVAAGILAAAAIVWVVLFGPHAGAPALERRLKSADQLARAGELDGAGRAWMELWNAGGRRPAIAARLAWAKAQGGSIGEAALWVMRGRIAGSRDAPLTWVTERVREAGGLVGAPPLRLPVTRLEWSLAALLLGLAAAVLWNRRRLAIGCASLALASTLVVPVEGWLATRAGYGVVLEEASLEGAGLVLQPGQAVTIRATRGGRVAVHAGREAEGWLPAAMVVRVTEAR